MSRKRSTYRPRSVISDPLSLLRPASKPQRDKVLLVFLSALEALARGEHPDDEDWRLLSDAINTIETLTLHMQRLSAAEVMPTVNLAIAAMVGAAKRYQSGQRMGVDGSGLQALRDVVGIYEKCLNGLTEREMAVAQQLTQQRVNRLLRSRGLEREVVSL